ncbi:hypothetical protein Xhom_03393 [Xenorhabdus hominickii]|uniref:Uncharacterized protein n=1 Tax=Xenorhabdus hominickii TaxID=351679 RepID=A0A2G0Q521_XENHO|nr:hypothetical protein Xhom_04817 [Xenorhabdus hominickii]PHM54316.1 hypothetical protein Xhom_03393 [Xenorhabdus hominickii]
MVCWINRKNQYVNLDCFFGHFSVVAINLAFKINTQKGH